MTQFTELLASEATAPEIEIDPANDLSVLPYSSGTTGLPKGVMLTHRNLVANIVQTDAAMPLEPEDVLIGVLPFFHIYGMTVIMNMGLWNGATIVTMPRFDLPQFLELIEKRQVTCAYVVPPIALALAKHPAIDEADLSSLRFIMSGAAPLGPELTDQVANRLSVPVTQGYGMTELSPVSHFCPIDAIKPGTIGPGLPGTESRLVDPESGEDIPEGADERGELWVRGPQVMAGYLNNDEATKETITDDGWLRTGDIAVVDSDGYFSIVDRLKELIKYKGFQVPPAELEAILIAPPGRRRLRRDRRRRRGGGRAAEGLHRRRRGLRRHRRGADGARRRAGLAAEEAAPDRADRRDPQVRLRQDPAPGAARRVSG